MGNLRRKTTWKLVFQLELDTADHFCGNYTEKFLKKYNFLMMSAIILDDKTMLRAIVKTKYGYIAVKYDDFVTYVGNGVWSVSHD